MGCCETRDNKEINSKLSVIQQHLKRNPGDPNAVRLGIEDYSQIHDEKALEILDYFFELESYAEWTTVLKDDTFSGKKLPSSIYSSEFLVTRIELDFELLVPMTVLVNVLVDPEQRMAWDSMLDYVQVISGDKYSNTTYKKIKMLFYQAEIIDRQVVTKVKDKVYIITYSVNEEIDVKTQRIKRAFNFFSVYQISDNGNKTEIVVVNQTDPSSRVSLLVGSVGIANQKLWMNQLKKRIVQVLSA